MSSINDLTEELVDYSLRLKFEDIPPNVIERAKQLFLDFLGVAAGGHSLSESISSVQKGVDVLIGNNEGTCTVIGESSTYPFQYAALLNSAMAHSIDFDDIHSEAHIHPGAPLFGALIAIAEQTNSDTSQFLRAVIVGYDIICKLGKAHGNLLHKRKMHPTSTTGIFGVTMAAGSLLGLNKDEISNAVAINHSKTSGSQQFLETGGWNKHLQVGFVAYNSLQSLILAQNGFKGSPKPLEGQFGYFKTYVVDGYNLNLAVSGLGNSFEVLETAVKPYPSCRYNHTTIDGIIDTLENNKINIDDIDTINITLSETGYGIVGRNVEPKLRPKSIIDAQFSVYFAAATAIINKSYKWESHTNISEQQILNFIDKIEVTSSPTLNDWGSQIKIKTTSEKEYTKITNIALGEPEKPLEWLDLESKFNNLWNIGRFGGNSNEIINKVKHLEKIGEFNLFSVLLRGI